MFAELAFSELPLLIFTVLVPLSVLAIGAMAYVGGTSEADEATLKKQDLLLSVPAALMLIGLAASFFHLGRPENVMGMISGFGRSPLSTEIVLAGAAIAVAAVYWIYALVKHPEKSRRKICGIVILALGIVCAVGTGIAYLVPTLPAWNSPWGIVLQLGLGIAGGAVLADVILSLASMDAGKPVRIAGIVGAALVVAGLCGLYATAVGVTPSSGAASAAGEGMPFLIGAIALVAGGAALQYAGGRKGNRNLLLSACVCVLVGLFVARMVFYGCYVNVGVVM